MTAFQQSPHSGRTDDQGASTAQDSSAATEGRLIVRVWKTHESSDAASNFPTPGDPALSLILDLISASHGVASISADKTVSARFSGIEPAILTARRLQWGIQGFSESKLNSDTSIAILAHGAADLSDLEAERSLQIALEQAGASQILIAPSIADALQGLTILHLQQVPDSPFQELLWRSSAIAPNRSLDEEAISAFIRQNGLEAEAPSPSEEAVPSEPLPATNTTRFPGTYPPVVNEPLSPSIVPVSGRGLNPRMLIGGAIAAVVLIVGGAILAFSHHSTPPAVSAPPSAVRQDANEIQHEGGETPTSPHAVKPSTPANRTLVAQGSSASPPQKDRKQKVKAESQAATAGSQEKPKETGGNCTLEPGTYQTTLDLAENNRANGNNGAAIRQFEHVIGCGYETARAEHGLDKAKAALHRQ
jgi:hypothetical protein